jgi:hypothetical protein
MRSAGDRQGLALRAAATFAACGRRRLVMCGGAGFRGHGIPDAEHIDGIDACSRQQERLAEASSTRASLRDD